MTQIVWGGTGTRNFEAGVDRGVLFPPNAAPGVPWNGLTAVNEAPSGGEPQPYYLDGVKYLQVASSEEFNATIEAFSAPPEFGPCDGTTNLYAGLFITQQPRKSFGLSFRTLIGNDVDNLDAGYKLHLVYGALAKPTSRARASLSDQVDAMALSWDITTVPPATAGIMPTAHLVINSITALPLHLQMIETLLYGTAFVAPRLPLPFEVMTIFAGSNMTVTDNGDGTFSAVGSDTDVFMPDANTFELWHETVVDNGDGTFTVPTGVDIG